MNLIKILINFIKIIIYWILILIDCTFILGSEIIAIQNEKHEFNKWMTIRVRAYYQMTKLLSIPFTIKDLKQLTNLNMVHIIWWKKGNYNMCSINLYKKVYFGWKIFNIIDNNIELNKYSILINKINEYYGYVVQIH